MPRCREYGIIYLKHQNQINDCGSPLAACTLTCEGRILRMSCFKPPER